MFDEGTVGNVSMWMTIIGLFIFLAAVFITDWRNKRR